MQVNRLVITFCCFSVGGAIAHVLVSLTRCLGEPVLGILHSLCIIAECAFVAFYASRVPGCCLRYRCCWRCRRALGSWARLHAQCHCFHVGRGRRDSGLLLLHLRLLDLQLLPLQVVVATLQVTPRLGSSHCGPRRSREAKAVCVTSPAQRCSLGLQARRCGQGARLTGATSAGTQLLPPQWHAVHSPLEEKLCGSLQHPGMLGRETFVNLWTDFMGSVIFYILPLMSPGKVDN